MRSRMDTALPGVVKKAAGLLPGGQPRAAVPTLSFYILMRMRSCTKVTFPIDCLFLALTSLWYRLTYRIFKKA